MMDITASSRFAFAVASVGAVLLLSACHQGSTVFDVDTVVDSIDANPGDGICADVSGACSLRGAVMEANVLPGVETIQLDDGAVYELTIPGTDEDASADGDLDVLSDVVIRGDALIQQFVLLGDEPIIETHHSTGLVEILGPDLLSGASNVRVTGGGAVLVVDATVYSFFGSAFEVHAGSLIVSHSEVVAQSPLHGTSPALLDAMGGISVIDTITVSMPDAFRPAVRVSDGDVRIKFSSFGDNMGTQLEVVDGATGSLIVQSSLITSPGTNAACVGAIQSAGYNVSDSTCPLGSATDAIDPYPVVGVTSIVDGTTIVAPTPFSSAIDNRPVDGECHVGRTDALWSQRPLGLGCDAGAVERPLGPCLSFGPGVNLVGCVLDGFDLRHGDLTGADLAAATAVGADFLFTTLDGADFGNADLRAADLFQLTANGTSFVGADLSSANVSGSTFAAADFTDANLAGVGGLAGADLTGAVFANTTCPTGVNSDTNGGDCVGQFLT